MKEIKQIWNPPFFYFHGICRKVCPTDSYFYGLSRSTRCGCDRKHYCKTSWKLEWNQHFLHLGYHGNGRHFDFFQRSKSCHTLRWVFLQSFMKFDERNPILFLNPFFFASMATAAKFVQPIPICLAYLVPLDVDVVPIKFHQFLFGE